MNNRTLVYLTILVLVGIGALFALNVAQILDGSGASQTYLKPYEIRGMAVKFDQMLYTLNFEQQNEVVDILNRSVRVVGVKPDKRAKPAIEKIYVYPFKDDVIEITPIAYVDNNNLVYSAPQWNNEGYLMEISNGKLHELLSQTYDH